MLDELKFLDSPTCDILKVPHLIHTAKVEKFPEIISPLLGDSAYRSVYGGEGFLPEDSFVYGNSFILSPADFNPSRTIDKAKKYLRAGPRKHIFFNP